MFDEDISCRFLMGFFSCNSLTDALNLSIESIIFLSFNRFLLLAVSIFIIFEVHCQVEKSGIFDDDNWMLMTKQNRKRRERENCEYFPFYNDSGDGTNFDQNKYKLGKYFQYPKK